MSRKLADLSTEELLRLRKIFSGKDGTSIGARPDSVVRHSMDVKFAMHVVRLLLEIEQILTEGDLDLQRNSEQLKSIRRGEWTVDEIEKWAASKEADLEKIYANCTILPWGPREDEIKQLLMDCLEHHYGSLQDAVTSGSEQGQRAIHCLQKISELTDNVLRVK